MGCIYGFRQRRRWGKTINRLNQVRSNWKINQQSDLREVASDKQIIETLTLLHLTNKTEEKVIIGLLNKRNECAHPSDPFTNIMAAIGYISDIIERIRRIQGKRIV